MYVYHQPRRPKPLQKSCARGFPSGIIRYNWNDAEQISMAPAQV